MKSGQNKKNKKIVVAMSGGVDSSVAAALLKQAGFDVVGVFMKFWNPSSPAGSSGQGRENRCCSVESEKLARQVAKKIGIPFYVLNAEKEFKKKVVDYFLKEYKKGNTPNPCVVCNKEIKFGLLIEKALKLGADFVATGHYAKIRPVLAMHCKDGPCNKLLKGKDREKDQSYFLWQLNQKQLSRILFPAGDYIKTEVRKLAKKFRLPTAKTPESQEICFVHTTINKFLEKYLKTKPGNIISSEESAGLRHPQVYGCRRPAKLLGGHQGLWFYTIGQRKGIEVPQGPYYVISKNYKNNNLIVSKNQKDLEGRELVAGSVNWISKSKLPLSAEVKIRYKSNFAKAKILKNNKNKVKIIFEKPQRAITPGQSAVFYKGEELLGGGVIE